MQNSVTSVPGLSAKAVTSSPARQAYFATDAWLTETIDSLERYRRYSADWDGRGANAPLAASINAAEMLTGVLSSEPEAPRLQFAMGTDGLPNFACSTPELYLHLVVSPGPEGSNENLGQLTWYATNEAGDIFESDVPFNGRDIPQGLRKLIEQP